MKTYEFPSGTDGERTWHDRKRYLWPLGLVVPMLPFAAVVLHAATGLEGFLWIGPLVLLGLVPIIDLVAGYDDSNPPDEVMEALEEDRYYRWVTYLFLPLQYAGFVAGAWVLATVDISVLGKIGLAVTLAARTSRPFCCRKFAARLDQRRLARIADSSPTNVPVGSMMRLSDPSTRRAILSSDTP